MIILLKNSELAWAGNVQGWDWIVWNI